VSQLVMIGAAVMPRSAHVSEAIVISSDDHSISRRRSPIRCSTTAFLMGVLSLCSTSGDQSAALTLLVIGLRATHRRSAGGPQPVGPWHEAGRHDFPWLLGGAFQFWAADNPPGARASARSRWKSSS
jgi:MYXO-CTERM domain-containing protein